jgi:drug/metabolite transporter (DMT)-like permease
MQNSPIKFTLLMIFAMLLWGGGWSALKILTEYVSVEVLTFWRFAIMSITFFPVLFFFKEPLKLPRKSLKYIAMSSILNILFMLFAYLGVKYSTAGSGGVIITILSPLFTFLLSLLILKHVHTNIQYIGLSIGIVGGMIMLNIQNMQWNNFLYSGEPYFILAAITWAFITLASQRSHVHINPVHYSFFISVISTILLFIFTLPYDISMVFEQSSRFWIALLYLGVFAQTIATTTFFVASGRLGSSKASSFMFLVPLFALVVSYLLLDEAIKMHIVLGGTISLIAVYFINKKTKA